MAILAYVLSFGTALACAALLTRAYRASRSRLLFWSGLCFWCLSFANGVAIADVFVVPDIDLYWIRLSAGLLGISLLLYGLVWESK